MKKIIIIALFLIFQLNLSYGGGNTCYRFKVEIETMDDTITGYVGLGDNFRTYKDFEILKYLNDYYKNRPEGIVVYDTIYNLNYPKMNGYKLTAVLDKDKKNVAVEKIRRINILMKCPCQEWTEHRDENNHERFYAWVGHTMLISELTSQEIELLQKEPKHMISFGDPLSEYSGYYLLSYNDTFTKDEINKIIDDFKVSITTYSGNKSKYVFQREEYAKLKNQLRKEQIIFFRMDDDV